jgi:hypothetical protein
MIKLCLDNTGLKRPITILESLIQLGSAIVNELVFCARQIWQARLSSPKPSCEVSFPVAPNYVASDSVLKLPQSNEKSLFFSVVMKSWALVTINLFFLLRCTYFDPA